MKSIMKWLLSSGRQRTIEIAEIGQQQRSLANALLCYMI